VAKNPPIPPPPRANVDPYGFSKPQRAATTNFAGGPPPKKPQRQYTQQETPASAGAAKFNAFTRAGNQTWDRQSFEAAARAEAARGFSQMRGGQQTPEMPPRPPRPHPTAARPVSSDMPNGLNPGFPGVSRTTSARRPDSGYGDVPRSAYSHVYGTRSNQAQPPPDHWSGHSPPSARTSHSPLRHSKSTEQPQPSRPGLFDRQPSRYNQGATHIRTDLKEGLYRSASVRNSPIDPQWEDASDSGPFGKSRPQQGTQRHRSASPNMRQTSGSTNYSESESDSSDDQGTSTASRKTAQPRRPQARAPAHDGLDSQASFKNYTRVVHEQASYKYPPPEPKQPTRAPFPDVTSSDDVRDGASAFRYELFRSSPRGPRINGLPSWAVPSSVPIVQTNFSSAPHIKPDPVFKASNFDHDWAEKLRTSGSTSPTKAGQKARGRARTNPSTQTDPMDVDPGDAIPLSPRTNGTGINNLNDLKTAGPFHSTGLNGVDDLKNTLPFESRASTNIKTEQKPSARLRLEDLPQPPKQPMAPRDSALLANNSEWLIYSKRMRQYMHDWKLFDRAMVEHFNARQRQLDNSMADDWVGMKSDGPLSCQVGDENTGGMKAGLTAYVEWLQHDEMCHSWWERARQRHVGCVKELAHVRSVVKGEQDGMGAL
jgi:hypothetical protein